MTDNNLGAQVKLSQDDLMLKVVNNEDLRKKFNEQLAIITQHFQLIDDQRDCIKDIIDALHQDTGLDKSLIRKLAKTKYQHNFADVVQEHETFETVYEQVVQGVTKSE